MKLVKLVGSLKNVSTDKTSFAKDTHASNGMVDTFEKSRPSVFMLEPGVFDIDGVKIFAYGGAPSHDIQGGILNPAVKFLTDEFKKPMLNGQMPISAFVSKAYHGGNKNNHLMKRKSSNHSIRKSQLES